MSDFKIGDRVQYQFAGEIVKGVIRDFYSTETKVTIDGEDGFKYPALVSRLEKI